MMYQITTAGVPTFFLNSEIQGIASAFHAADIAREIINDSTATITVMTPDGKVEVIYGPIS